VTPRIRFEIQLITPDESRATGHTEATPMQRPRLRSTWLGTCLLLLATQASALSFDDVALEGTVGSGANESIILVDWDSGVTESHAWLFQWDGVASYGDAFDAIMASVAGFSGSQSSFVTFMDYDDGVDAHVTEFSGWLSFWESADGESWATTFDGVYTQALVDGGWAGVNANLPEIWPGDAPSVPTVIPEPSTALLLALGLGAVTIGRRRWPRGR